MYVKWEESFDLLIADENDAFIDQLSELLEPCGFAIRKARDFEEATEQAQGDPPQFMLLGIRCESPLPLKRLQAWMNVLPGTRVLALMDEPLETYERLLRQIGVSLVIPRRLSLRQIAAMIVQQGELLHLEHQNVELRQMLNTRMAYENLLGGSPPMRSLYRLIDQIARTDTPILITGEEGTERIEVARAIHQKSHRALYPLLVVDCAKEVEDAAATRIFGPLGEGQYSTGPSPYESVFARAGKGSVVLHRIEAIAAEAQARLLDFLHRPFFQNETPGTPQPLARLIVTAGPNLLGRVESGQFMRELFYRLNILQVRVPALRDRREDIPILAHHFLRLAIQQLKRQPAGKGFNFSSDVILRLFQYDWPGNLSELENVIREVTEHLAGPQIELDDLPAAIRQPPVPDRKIADFNGFSNMALKEAKRLFETEYFKQLLRRTKGNMTKASRFSRVGRPYLYKKIREYGIEPDVYR